MAPRLSDLASSVDRFLQAWLVVRMCPQKIDAKDEMLKFNPLTLAVTLVIFFLARSTVSGLARDPATDLVATVISSFVIFVTGFVGIIFSPGSGIEGARKWGMFFIFTWIVSLLLAIVIDGIPIWNHVKPTSSLLIDAIFVPGTLSALVKNLLRAILFSLLALAIMFIKTKIMVRKSNSGEVFNITTPCALASIGAGLIMNSVLLLLFLYSNII